MIEVRPFNSLGGANHGWLDAHHHFSFAEYYNPKRMSWGRLRVWNDDLIAPKSGFPPHPHRDMEIITYVRTGAITHEDSMGNKGRTARRRRAGHVRRHGRAPRRVQPRRREHDAVPDLDRTRSSAAASPSWGAKQFPKTDRTGQWSILASGKGDEGALGIRADARVAGVTLEAGQEIVWETTPERHVYAVAATGAIEVEGQRANARDGVAVTAREKIIFRAVEGPAEIVLTDTL